MSPGAAHALVRVAAVIPAVLLVLFIGLLWLLGLPCDRERHRYVTDLSQQAMKLVIALNGGSTPLKAAQAGQPGSQGTCRAAMRRSSGWRRSGRS